MLQQPSPPSPVQRAQEDASRSNPRSLSVSLVNRIDFLGPASFDIMRTCSGYILAGMISWDFGDIMWNVKRVKVMIRWMIWSL